MNMLIINHHELQQPLSDPLQRAASNPLLSDIKERRKGNPFSMTKIIMHQITHTTITRLFFQKRKTKNPLNRRKKKKKVL